MVQVLLHHTPRLLRRCGPARPPSSCSPRPGTPLWSASMLVLFVLPLLALLSGRRPAARGPARLPARLRSRSPLTALGIWGGPAAGSSRPAWPLLAGDRAARRPLADRLLGRAQRRAPRAAPLHDHAEGRTRRAAPLLPAQPGHLPGRGLGHAWPWSGATPCEASSARRTSSRDSSRSRCWAAASCCSSPGERGRRRRRRAPPGGGSRPRAWPRALGCWASSPDCVGLRGDGRRGRRPRRTPALVGGGTNPEVGVRRRRREAARRPEAARRRRDRRRSPPTRPRPVDAARAAAEPPSQPTPAPTPRRLTRAAGRDPPPVPPFDLLGDRLTVGAYDPRRRFDGCRSASSTGTSGRTGRPAGRSAGARARAAGPCS